MMIEGPAMISSVGGMVKAMLPRASLIGIKFAFSSARLTVLLRDSKKLLLPDGAASGVAALASPGVRAVLLRDRHCCQVPGCRHVTFVDLHHVRAREDGGGFPVRKRDRRW